MGVAIYGAAIIAMQPKSADGTATTPVVSVELWVIFLIATPIVVFLLGWVAGSDRLVRRVLLSIPAFIIWTASIPHSAWAKLGVFNDTATAVIALAVLALVAAVFAPVADKLVGES